MKLSPQWVREFVELGVDGRRLDEDLTAVGIAVEGINGTGPDTVFEMEIGTNRPDAMNHYGVAREAAAIYDLPLKPIEPRLPSGAKAPSSAGLRGATGSRALSKQTPAASHAAGRSRGLSDHGRRAAALSKVFRPSYMRNHDQGVARKNCAAAALARSAAYQQRRRCHQLRPLGDREADPRFRHGSARGRQDHCA